MMAHFSELDGTTFQRDIPQPLPEIRMLIAPSISCFLQRAIDDKPLFKQARYQLVGVSGDIAFYDRKVCMDEFE